MKTNWNQVEWTKSNCEIAATLGCTPSAVYYQRKKRGIPRVARVRAKQKIPVLIQEPIDYQRLAAAFRATGWRWHTGYPDAEQLERAITADQAELSRRPGECRHSGGINLEWRGNKIVVYLHPRLAKHYV